MAGPFLLTHLLLDKLKESAPSRIINVSCAAHKRKSLDFENFNIKNDYTYDKAYGISKLAMMYFSEELDNRLKRKQSTGLKRVVFLNAQHFFCRRDPGQHILCIPWNRFYEPRQESKME